MKLIDVNRSSLTIKSVEIKKKIELILKKNLKKLLKITLMMKFDFGGLF